MHQQRKALRAGELEDRRKTLLDAPEAGMVWEPGEEAWEAKLAALRSYRKATGHLAPRQDAVWDDPAGGGPVSIGQHMANLRRKGGLGKDPKWAAERAGVRRGPLDHGGVPSAAGHSGHGPHLAAPVHRPWPGRLVRRPQARRPEEDHRRRCRAGDRQDARGDSEERDPLVDPVDGRGNRHVAVDHLADLAGVRQSRLRPGRHHDPVRRPRGRHRQGHRLPDRRHRAAEFKKFLAKLDKEVSEGLDVHFILDNYATHQTPDIKKWLLAHPRFHLHFTPTSASWLNLVERWFAELTQKKLKRGVHRSVQALERNIRAWLTDWNETPQALRLDEDNRRNPRQSRHPLPTNH
ncbi:hypothetical protein GCM10010282_73300 [Streptomyces roseolus]|nr:hypothetical protein GCM10010282_73300 [Streptomyces roseolus]